MIYVPQWKQAPFCSISFFFVHINKVQHVIMIYDVERDKLFNNPASGIIVDIVHSDTSLTKNNKFREFKESYITL